MVVHYNSIEVSNEILPLISKLRLIAALYSGSEQEYLRHNYGDLYEICS